MVKNSEIKLFTKNGELISIADPLHAKILGLLESDDLTFKDIHQSLDRAKSTVSLKIGELLQRGLISENVFEQDKRVKMYTLLATHVGSNTKGTPQLFENAIAKLDMHVDNPFEFVNAMFRSVWYLLDSFGVDSEQMLTIMGENVGKQIAGRINSTKKQEIINELSELYQKHKLGYIEIISEEPLRFKLFDCYQCGNLKEFDRKLCAFDNSLIKTIFCEKGVSGLLEKKSCAKQGNTFCVYQIHDHL